MGPPWFGRQIKQTKNRHFEKIFSAKIFSFNAKKPPFFIKLSLGLAHKPQKFFLTGPPPIPHFVIVTTFFVEPMKIISFLILPF